MIIISLNLHRFYLNFMILFCEQTFSNKNSKIFTTLCFDDDLNNIHNQQTGKFPLFSLPHKKNL